MHDLLFSVSLICLIILLLIFVLKRFRQPHFIAYILAGVLLGPHVTGVLTDTTAIANFGELGILLLMFFLGMEVQIPDNRSLLLKPIMTQGVKTLVTTGSVLLVGHWQGWNISSMLVVATMLIFNSTAVVTEFMRKTGELENEKGKIILNVLLLQDIMLAPVLTLFQFTGNRQPDPFRLVFAIAGSILLFLLLRAIRNRNLYQLPLVKELENDHDLQVFVASLICVGFAEAASLAGLTGTIGSFAAGLFIGQTKAFDWMENVLKPFKVFFVSLFFVSVGLWLDLDYLQSSFKVILLLVAIAFLFNNFIAAIVFRALKLNWKESMYLGALLSQVGEFGILACSLAYQMRLIDVDLFKTGIAVTCISLLCSTVWISVIRKFTKQESGFFMFRHL